MVPGAASGCIASLLRRARSSECGERLAVSDSKKAHLRASGDILRVTSLVHSCPDVAMQLNATSLPARTSPVRIHSWKDLLPHGRSIDS